MVLVVIITGIGGEWRIACWKNEGIRILVEARIIDCELRGEEGRGAKGRFKFKFYKISIQTIPTCKYHGSAFCVMPTIKSHIANIR